MIELKHLKKRYGDRYALDDVTLTIPKGQILGLLGQNGAGKTTAMNIMTGCLAPSEGKVLIDGHDILFDSRNAKRLIGYLPEQAPLYEEMTVVSYLRFACRLKEIQESSISQHIEAIAEKTGLAEVLDRRISNLSKGYRQRVGFAQALCGNPEFIVLDEPTVGLDPKQTSEFRLLIKTLSGSHTVIFSSHILSEVQSICDRVAILHHGKIISDSSLDSLRGCEQRLRASIAMGEGSLLPALRSVDAFTRVDVVRGGEAGVTNVILTVKKDSQPERALFTLLCGLQAPLLRLMPVEDSLEDIFLRVTEE